MSFVKNDNQQLTVLDSTFNLTEREKRMLEKSWAKTFADKVFPAIDENIFSVLSITAKEVLLNFLRQNKTAAVKTRRPKQHLHPYGHCKRSRE